MLSAGTVASHARLAYHHGMTLIFLGRGLLIGGLVALIVSAAPALILSVLPPPLSDSFLGTLAGLLLLTIVPLAAIVASAGALLLLLGWLQRRGRG